MLLSPHTVSSEIQAIQFLCQPMKRQFISSHAKLNFNLPDAVGPQLRSKRASIPQVDGAGDEEELSLPGNMMASAKSDALVDEESLFDSWLTEPEFPPPGKLFILNSVQEFFPVELSTRLRYE